MMNADHEKLLQSLEAATAADGRPPEELSGETAQMRATWLALGGLLDGMQPQQPAVLERLTLPADVAAARRRSSRRVAQMAILAAVLLLSVAVTYRWLLVRSDQAPATAAAPAVATEVPRPAPATAANNPTETPAAPASTATVAWDDSFDENVSEIAQGLIAVRSAALPIFGEMAAVQDGVQRIEEEVQGKSL